MNLPNKITTVRMVLVLVVIGLIGFPYSDLSTIPMIPYLDINILYFIAMIIFIIASFSDFLDGYLARKNNLVTTYGKFMDPIADKLLVNSCLIILSIKGNLTIPLIVTVIMICRDIIVDGIRLIAMEKGEVIAASWWGKIKTVAQMVAIVTIFLNDWPFKYMNLPFSVAHIFCYVAGAASLISGIIYVYNARHLFKGGM